MHIERAAIVLSTAARAPNIVGRGEGRPLSPASPDSGRSRFGALAGSARPRVLGAAGFGRRGLGPGFGARGFGRPRVWAPAGFGRPQDRGMTRGLMHADGAGGS